MPPITISYDITNETLTAYPSPLFVGQAGQGAQQISWRAGSNIYGIASVGITGVDTGAGKNPYPGTQPSAPSGESPWRWNDPDTRTATYEYVVSATVTGVGIRTLDPQIINRTG